MMHNQWYSRSTQDHPPPLLRNIREMWFSDIFTLKNLTEVWGRESVDSPRENKFRQIQITCQMCHVGQGSEYHVTKHV